MDNTLHFKTRDEFRLWLSDNCRSGEGVWLMFGKTKDLITLKSGEALEEALCFGWIDGLMKSVDENSYIKYFSERTKNSKWSAKNKSLAEKLELSGQMTDLGREKIEEAKRNGAWENAKGPAAVSADQIELVAQLLQENELAHTNFQNMSPSVKKTYARAYFDVKTDAGRSKRLNWMTERLEKNLKPM